MHTMLRSPGAASGPDPRMLRSRRRAARHRAPGHRPLHRGGPITHAPVTLAVLLLSAPMAHAQEIPERDPLPLFASHEVLALRIEAPLATIFKDRSQDSDYHPGTLAYVDAAGDTIVLDIRAKTRGHFRLQRRICDFPNLQIDFDPQQVAHTVFAGLNHVRVVAHCQDRKPEYEQFTLQEYLVYRTFNQLTDVSVRVRLARATYVDTDGQRETVTKYLFLLEPFETTAARHGWTVLEVPAVAPRSHDRFGLPLVEVFQFMIGNTDWSPFEKSTSGICCHNGRLIGTMAGPVFLVPYDFDLSGVISAPYARPAPEARVRWVSQRRYWGICRPEEDFQPVFARFMDRRAAIDDLWRGQEGLDADVRERSLAYIEEFYRIIDDPGRTRYEIVRDCRDMSHLDR